MPPSHAWMVCHTNPCKFLNFILSLNLSLTHLRAQIACYELKGDLNPVMLKEIFHNSFKISGFVWKTIHVWLCGKSCFLIQIPQIFSSHCNHYFWDIWLKICRLPKFNMLFQLVLTIFFQKQTVFVFTETWSYDQLMQKPIKEDRIKNIWQLKTFSNCPGKKEGIWQVITSLFGFFFPQTPPVTSFHHRIDHWFSLTVKFVYNY